MLFWILLGINLITSFIYGVYLAATWQGFAIFFLVLFLLQLIASTILVGILSATIKRDPKNRVRHKLNYYPVIKFTDYAITYIKNGKEKILPFTASVDVQPLPKEETETVLEELTFRDGGFWGVMLWQVEEYEPEYTVYIRR